VIINNYYNQKGGPTSTKLDQSTWAE